MTRTRSFARILTSSLAVGLLSLSSVAHAQTDPNAPPPPVESAPTAVSMTGGSTVPAALVARSVVLPNGTLEIRQAGLNIGMSKGNAFKPIHMTIPNISFGIAENLEVGIYSGVPSPAFAPTGGARGFCVTGKESCPDRFDTIGVEGIYKFLAGDFQLAGHGALNFGQIKDPMKAQLALGVLGKFQSGNFALVFDPAIYFGLNKRDGGNKEALSIPVSAQLQVQPNLAAFLNTGIFGPFDHFGDFYQAPLGVGALFNVNPMIDVGGAFTFSNLLGKQFPGGGRADRRELFLFVNIRPIAI